MLCLGIDACLGHCSVALIRGDDTLAQCSEAMTRGHVERLAPMVSEVLRDAGVAPASLDRIGVTCGPGGFTGARLGAAFARGVALASGCRAVGVTTLQALAFPHADGPVVVALDGRRGELFVQRFGAGAEEAGPVALPVESFADFLKINGSPFVVGPRDVPAIDPANVARIAAMQAKPESPRPALSARTGCESRGPACFALMSAAAVVIDWYDRPPDAETLENVAALMARAYAPTGLRAYSAAEIADLLNGPAGRILIARDRENLPCAVLLANIVDSEGEILALAVNPDTQRQNIASQLIGKIVKSEKGDKVDKLVLEVAMTNRRAIAFYEMLNFHEIGIRRNYYRIDGVRVHAKLLSKRYISE